MKRKFTILILLATFCLSGFSQVTPIAQWMFNVTSDGYFYAEIASSHGVEMGDSSQTYVAFAMKNDRWGCINEEGKWIIEQKFLTIKNIRDGIALVETRLGWEYVDLKMGTLKNSMNYEATNRLHKNYKLVMAQIDHTLAGSSRMGNLLVRNNFSENFAYVRVGKKWGYINRKGKLAIEAIYKRVGEFSDGLAQAMIAEKWGYIDTMGSMVIEPKFDVAKKFYNGVALIEFNKKWNYVDKKGNLLLDNNEFDVFHNFSDSLARVEKSNRFGYLNTKGVLVIEAKYVEARNFCEEMAAVKISGHWGFINKKGEMVIEAKYERIKDFNEGIAIVLNKNEWLFVDKVGKEQKLDFKFDLIYNFHDGLARFQLNNGKTGFIDKNGIIVIQPGFDNIRNFKNGFAFFRVKKLWGFINTEGKIIKEPFYQSIKDFELIQRN